MDCGREVTLTRILPKGEQADAYKIIITDNFLLLPIVGRYDTIAYSKFYLVWDGKLKINDSNHGSAALIFVQSVPENISWRGLPRGGTLRIGTRPANWRPYSTREAKHLYIQYVSFDLTKLRDAYANSVTLNLLGLDFEMEYTYP
jgi:hypothetical protein